ncbi:glucosylglycerol-phosphate synthase [Microbacterium amylolyticum]|uniref:Glucosylglycerol-phosphate synthase n=1 Tax=Microbacterium amylolyticum TaxID=936337 RepID=A0ABS4ZEJ3_9MICO|nr:glucosylglycerol-phosphate synthase [Microbacterium amylolyticum]MBP2435703.1 glucosylglycerol-phosphate synthase [Microbacterium amylolyticum]
MNAQQVTAKSDLVVVYHRQPYEEVTHPDGSVELRENSSPNGIVPTIKGVMGRMKSASWVAWKHADDPDNPQFEQIIDIDDSYGSYQVNRLPLTEHEVSSFYHLTSKEAFWPILHGFKERYNYDPVDWDTFRDVNRRFAQAAADAASDDAVVWIHDYNLWLVPGYLRQLRPDVKIAFFHHTPFPASGMFNVLPWREEIIRSLLEADSIGFHIPRYAQSFVSVARSLTSARTIADQPTDPDMSPRGDALSERWTPTLMDHHGHTIHIETNPVGVNDSYVEELTARDGFHQRVQEIRDWVGDATMILSVSRTDYTKGNVEQLETFERLLVRRPELRGKVRLMLVSVGANRAVAAYDEVQQRIEELTGRINGTHGSFQWQPVSLISTAIPMDELVAYYRAADICSITPLADGLNLVAPEYCIAQGDDGAGVLILSEFAGSAVLLEGQIPVNPFSFQAMDKALDAALEMSGEERRERMRDLVRSSRRWNITAWSEATMALFRALRRGEKPEVTPSSAHASDRTSEIPIVSAPDTSVG